MPRVNSSRNLGHILTGYVYIAPPPRRVPVKTKTEKKRPAAWTPETGFVYAKDDKK